MKIESDDLGYDTSLRYVNGTLNVLENVAHHSETIRCNDDRPAHDLRANETLHRLDSFRDEELLIDLSTTDLWIGQSDIVDET